MIDLVPSSRSIVLSSPQILHVRVVKAAPGEWEEIREETFRRRVALELEIREAFKRGPSETVRGPVEVAVTQYESRMLMTQAVPGAWSGFPLEPGVEYVVFCGDGATPADLLTEPPAVCPTEEVLPDVRLAREVETEALPLDKVIARAAAAPGSIGRAFVVYLWAKHGAVAIRHEHDAELILSFLTSPELRDLPRNDLLTAIIDDLSVTSNVPASFTRRFALALFQIVELPQAAMLHDNILGVYLPNLLGVVGGGEKTTARAVFGDDAARRREIESLLRARPGAASEKLLAWIVETGSTE